MLFSYNFLLFNILSILIKTYVTIKLHCSLHFYTCWGFRSEIFELLRGREAKNKIMNFSSQLRVLTTIKTVQVDIIIFFKINVQIHIHIRFWGNRLMRNKSINHKNMICRVDLLVFMLFLGQFGLFIFVWL